MKEAPANVTLITIKMNLPGCSSLKEKRSRLLPIITRLRKQFNTGIAETGLQDIWQSALFSCVLVSNSGQLNGRTAGEIIKFIEIHFPDELVEDFHLEQR